MDEPAPFFPAIDAYFTDEGMVFVCPTEADAQRAYCEAQLRKINVKLEDNKIVLLAFGKKDA